MRKISWLALLSLWIGALALPAAAQAQQTCNGLAATQVGDLLYGTDGDDVLIGTAGADRIYAEGGNDTICSLGGDDRVAPGPGDDHVDGGDGSDWLEVERYQASAPVVVDLPNGTSSGADGSDQLVDGSIENAEMNCSSVASDTLIGDDDDNILSGGSGADTISGGAGDDLIYGTDPSFGRTDAICWSGDADDDELSGGPGDDVLLGQAGNDDIDGSEGWDVLDGGWETDSCLNGERYAGCETIRPLPPPPHCSDGVDNDEDGQVDSADDGCAHPNDPTEDVLDDPGCNDGVDNDDDRRSDFPHDAGCLELEDETELDHCIGPCPPPFITIEHQSGRALFSGHIAFAPDACLGHRLVLLRRSLPGRDRTVGRDRTNDRGVWKVGDRRPRRGRFYALTRATQVTMAGGEVVDCTRMRSALLRIQP